MENVPRSEPRTEVEAKVEVTFAGVEFVCPRCGSKRWGTSGLWGTCHGKPLQLELDGPLRTRAGYCVFRWMRALDWTVFKRVGTGLGFMSSADFNSHVARRRPRR